MEVNLQKSGRQGVTGKGGARKIHITLPSAVLWMQKINPGLFSIHISYSK